MVIILGYTTQTCPGLFAMSGSVDANQDLRLRRGAKERT
jgi:hypothetical protein